MPHLFAGIRARIEAFLSASALNCAVLSVAIYPGATPFTVTPNFALALASSGADIIGVSSKPEPGGATEEGVIKAGRKYYSYQCDLTDRKSLYAFIEKVKADHPTIDILINNAGHILRKPVAEHPDEYWDTIIRINLDAQFILTRELGKRMIERGQGKIVFTCSLLYSRVRTCEIL